jgi:transcription elongation factor SPT5
MRKSMDLEYAGQPLSVYSAFQRDSLPGMLYIEARSMAHVEQAIRGLVGIYISSGITLVPIEDMSALLKIKKNVVEIIPGSWVRIKRGKYQGDLAQVLDITENGEEVGLKFIPRIDYNPKDDAQEKKRKKGLSSAASALAGRPPLKFFSADEVSRAYGGRSVVKRGSSHVFQGDTFKNGFIEKDFKITGISTENVDPTLEEVTRFSGENADDDQDYTAIAEARAKAALTVLQPGDHVEVYEGEQAGLLGTVDSITGEIVRIRASHGGLQGQTIDVQGRSVRKNFKPGDHVKVMAGKSQNETGLVVSVAENIVTFLSDLSQQEVRVFPFLSPSFHFVPFFHALDVSTNRLAPLQPLS